MCDFYTTKFKDLYKKMQIAAMEQHNKEEEIKPDFIIENNKKEYHESFHQGQNQANRT